VAGDYLLFLWSSAGYTLREMSGELPDVGHEFDEGEHTLVVTKLGASPLPGDDRRCAFAASKS